MGRNWKLLAVGEIDGAAVAVFQLFQNLVDLRPVRQVGEDVPVAVFNVNASLGDELAVGSIFQPDPAGETFFLQGGSLCHNPHDTDAGVHIGNIIDVSVSVSVEVDVH